MAEEPKKRATRAGAEPVSDAQWKAEEDRIRAEYQKKLDEAESGGRSGGRSYNTEKEAEQFDREWKEEEAKKNADYQRRADEKRAEEDARELKQRAEQEKENIQKSKDKAAHEAEEIAAGFGPEGMAVSAGIEVARNQPIIGGMVDKKLGKLTGEDKKQKEAAKKEKEAARAARKAEKEAAKEKAKAARAERIEAIKGAASTGGRLVKGGAKLGYGMASVAAETSFKIAGSIFWFFIAAMVIHLVDALTGFGDNKGITMFRFGMYLFLCLYAWFALYGGASTGGLNTLRTPAAISLLAFFLPLIVNIILTLISSTTMANTITSLLLIFPLWPIIVAFGMAPHESKFFMFVRLAFIIIWVGFALSVIPSSVSMDLNLGESKIAVWEAMKFIGSALKKFFASLFVSLKAIPAIITGGVQRQISYATGDYYTGMVDENQNEPIGVYLEDLQAASSRFFEEDSVVIWGVIRARTLDPDKEIKILTTCYAHSSEINPDIAANFYADYSLREIFNRPSLDSSIKEGKIDASALGGQAGVNLDVSFLNENIVGGDADPSGPGNIFEMNVAFMEEKDITCDFAPGKLKKGNWQVTFLSVFNFDTYSYLKTYFMDQDRLRAIRRQDKDPLDVYGISDKVPVAIFTNGPVKVGMETTQPLTGLSSGERNEVRLGITLENRWQGQIKEIRDLIIKIPPSMSVAFCDHNIKAEPCRGDECEDGKYSVVYRLQEGSDGGKRGKQSLKNIDKFQSFNCRLNVENVDAALGDVPIVTHYFKVSADYIYELKGSVPITVEKVGQ